MNSKPFEAGGKWFWYRYLSGGPFIDPCILPVCYFVRLKAGTLHSHDGPGYTTQEYDAEAAALEDLAQAIETFEAEPRLGTPINQLSGVPGTKGYDAFCRIAESWGYG